MDNVPVVSLGLVGCGGIAYEHGHAQERYVPDVRFAACADANLDAARNFAERFGVPRWHPSLQEMLAGGDVDGIFIATWPSNHLQLIEECIRAGAKKILCEKPIVLNRQEALRLWAVANEAGATVLEGLMYRHHPAIIRLEELARGGDIGELDHVRASFSYFKAERLSRETIDPNDPHRPWRFRRNDGGGALYDIGVYAINACTALAASLPVRAVAFGRSNDNFGVADKAIGMVEYANGCVGEVESTEAASTTQEIQVSGSLGSLFVPQAWTIYEDSVIELRRPVPSQYRPLDRPFAVMTDRFAAPAANGWACQLANFGRMIRGGEPPRITLAESVVNTCILDALVTSLESGEIVDIVIPEDVAQQFEKTRMSA
jgi:predicted dehydrogenase